MATGFSVDVEDLPDHLADEISELVELSAGRRAGGIVAAVGEDDRA